MAADPLPRLSHGNQLSLSEDTCLSAIPAKDKMSLEVSAIPIAHTPPTSFTNPQSQDTVEVKNRLEDNDISAKGSHDAFQPGTPSSAGSSTLRESKSVSPDGGKNGTSKLSATPLKLSPSQQQPPCSLEPCDPTNKPTPLQIKVSPSSMQSSDRSPAPSPLGQELDQQEGYSSSALTAEEAIPTSTANETTGLEPEQDRERDDSMAVEYIPFDAQPLWDLVAQCKQKSIQDLQTICRDLDSLNTEIQFVLSDFLTMRFAEIEQMLTSGQIDIAQMEQEQAEMQSQMVSFLNAIKNAFSFFGHDSWKQP